jgi:5-methylcytosine-specific restriction enzyme subunit McrC
VSASVRITLPELAARPLIDTAAEATGLSPSEVRKLLEETSRRLQAIFSLKKEPIEFSGNQVQIEDVAGLIRVSPTLELEVPPKFLGENYSGWREDFLRIASLTRSGNVLVGDDILAGVGDSNDLASILGRSLVGMYQREKRQPLRLYRRRIWDDFAIDGDVDAESLVIPHPAGFRQEKIVFDPSNGYNAIIRKAARLLAHEAEDRNVRHQLEQMVSDLSPQRQLPPNLDAVRRLPNRNQRWQPLVDLAIKVVQGFGLDITRSGIISPGFVMITWSAWEQLSLLSLRAGLRDALVLDKKKFELGMRDGEPFFGTPDATLILCDETLIADAKYKTSVERAKPTVSSADVYEAWAFLDGASAQTAVLLYPAPATDTNPQPAGTAACFHTVTRSDGKIIRGFLVECRGLARVGLRVFGTNLASSVLGKVGLAPPKAA